MTRDDIAPTGQDDPGFSCPTCGGSGRYSIQGLPVWTACHECGGSGYGPPPPEMDKLMAHCLRRLAAWAQRNLPNEEQ